MDREEKYSIQNQSVRIEIPTSILFACNNRLRHYDALPFQSYVIIIRHMHALTDKAAVAFPVISKKNPTGIGTCLKRMYLVPPSCLFGIVGKSPVYLINEYRWKISTMISYARVWTLFKFCLINKQQVIKSGNAMCRVVTNHKCMTPIPKTQLDAFKHNICFLFFHLSSLCGIL